MVIGYSRAWLRRPEVGIRVKRSLFESLDPEGQSLLRFEPVVSDDDFGEWVRPSCLLVCALPVSIYLSILFLAVLGFCNGCFCYIYCCNQPILAGGGLVTGL